MKTLLKRLLLHPQRTLDLEYQDGGDDFKILLCMRDPVLFRSMLATKVIITGILSQSIHVFGKTTLIVIAVSL